MTRAGETGTTRQRAARRVLGLGLTAAVVAVGVGLPGPATADVTQWLDSTFGSAGTTVLPGEPATDISNADPQDRIYVISGADGTVQNTTTTRLRRLLANGTADATFGGGSVILAANETPFQARRVHADTAGTVTVATQSANTVSLSRFTGAGTPDATFGPGGTMTALTAAGVGLAGLVERSGGGYLVGALLCATVGNTFVCHLDVIAVANNGQLDPAWAPTATTPGVLELGFDGSLAGVDGTSVLLVRNDFNPATSTDDIPKLVRLTATGGMDASFSGDGVLDLPDRFQSTGDAFVTGGAYYLVGRLTGDDFDTHPAAVRALASGSVDASFGTASVALGVARQCGDYAGRQVFATASHVYVVAGGGCGDPPMAVNRFDLAGVLDPAYGDDGHVLVDVIAGRYDVGGFAAMQSDGRIVGFVGALGPVTEDGVAFRLTGSDPVASAGSFVSLPPARILDTRNGTGAPAGPIPGGGSIDLQITGVGGVPAGVGAVVLNLTVTQPTWDGSVVAYPTGQPKPLASNLNFAQSQTIPNLVTVKLGTGGKVTLANNQIAGKTLHLVADVAGYYLSGTAIEPGTYTPLVPTRILDTRNGTGVTTAGTIPAGGSIELLVAGHGGVPAAGVGAVVMNVTVTQPSWDGNVVAYPTGQPKPLASNLNFAQSQTIPNLVTVKLGTAGKVTLTNNSIGTVHLIADVAGYYLAGTAVAKGTFVPLTPFRVLDTRNGTGGYNAPVGAHGEIRLGFSGSGVPEQWVSAVVMNVTVTQPTWDGSVVAYPTGTTAPLASNLNFKPGITIPNLVIAKLGGGFDKTIQLRNNSVQGTVHLIVDVSGYFNN